MHSVLLSTSLNKPILICYANCSGSPHWGIACSTSQGPAGLTLTEPAWVNETETHQSLVPPWTTSVTWLCSALHTAKALVKGLRLAFEEGDAAGCDREVIDNCPILRFYVPAHFCIHYWIIVQRLVSGKQGFFYETLFYCIQFCSFPQSFTG